MNFSGILRRIDHEVVKKILISLVAFVGCFFSSVFYIHSQSIFLDQIGPQQLPFILLCESLLVILYSVLSSFFSNKISALSRFIIVTFLISVFYASLSLLTGSLNLQIYLFLFISSFFVDFMDIVILNLLSTIMTPLQVKNSYPLVNSLGSLGTIVGSYFVLDLQKFYERFPFGLFPAISVITMVLLGLILMKFFHKDLRARAELQKEQKIQSKDELKNGFELLKNSKLFKTLAWVSCLILAIAVFTNFKLKTVLSLNYKGDELTDIIAKVTMLQCGLAFLMDFFLTQKLLFKFGVNKLMWVYPLILMASLALALSFGLSPVFVIVFILFTRIPINTFIPAAISQIFLAAPKKESESIYFIINGVLSSAVELLLYFSLFIYSININWEQTLNTGLIAFLIIVLFFATLKLTRNYQKTLQGNLLKDDVYVKQRAIELLAEQAQRDKGENDLLRLLDSKNLDEESRLKTINTLGIIGDYDSIVNLIDILKKGNPKEIFAAIQAINTIIRNKKKFDRYPLSKHLLLKTYKEMFISYTPSYIKFEIISSLKYFNLDEIIDFFETNLTLDDPQIKTNILEMMSTFHDKGIVSYAGPFLSDKNPRVVASAIVALWQFSKLRLDLIPKMESIFSNGDPEHVESALFLIGSIKAFWEKKYVEEKLKSSDRHIHNYALLTMLILGDKKYANQFVQEFTELTKNGPESEIEFSLTQYRKFNQEIKDLVISKIQQMPTGNVHSIQNAFQNSKYIFSQELYHLSS